MSKTYRRKWFHQGATIRQRGDAFQAEINEGGKRYRKTLAALAEAKTHIEQKLIEIGNYGAAAFALDDKQRHAAIKAFKQLGNIPLSDAVAFHLRHHKTSGRIMLPIRIVNPHTGATWPTYGLLDTGATTCLFPGALATYLGHKLKGAGVAASGR